MEDKSVQKTCYNEMLGNWQPTAISTNETIIDLSIVFQVGENEAAYFLFVTRVITYSSSWYSAMAFRFVIDGAILDEPYTVVGSFMQNDNHQYTPVVLQYSANTLSETTHTLSGTVESRHASGFIRGCTLLVQTYIP